MSIIGSAANAFFTYKFLRLLTQRWEDTDAFKLGIVDAEGKPLKKVKDLETSEEKSAYSLFNRLIFNLKRILNKLPFGKTRLASYAAALFLIKEHTGATDDDLHELTEELGLGDQFIAMELKESFFLSEGNLLPGKYKLTEDVINPISGEMTGRIGHTVVVEDVTSPIDTIMGVPIYKVKHSISGLDLYISSEGITR